MNRSRPSLDIFSALDRHAAERPEALALTDGSKNLSYRQLARRVAGLALDLAALPDVVGILAPNCLDWAIADLALAFAGRTMVPLPYFFSHQQLAHIVRDSGMAHVLTVPEWTDQAAGLGLPTSPIGSREAPFDLAQEKPGERIIYTSGTTGNPKGVRHGTVQLNASTRGLAAACQATAEDRYFSVLPFPLLLEQICGIHVPVLTGAKVCMSPVAAAACAMGNPAPLIEASIAFQPTVGVLVPELLMAWVAGLKMSGGKAPESLRYLAVGGAPVAKTLAEAAWDLGIPVHEGYGLSECCSVVAVNRPGQRTAETVGPPLEGLTVTIEKGEIVVSGDTVMEGYLGRDAVSGPWHTGDLGELDPAGNLIIHGRKDNVLVLATGRNLSPEWIEGLILNDSRVGRAVVIGHGQSAPTVVLVPSLLGADWFKQAGEEEITALIENLCIEAPDYAKPRHHAVVSEAELSDGGLLTANGRPRRAAIAGKFLGA